MTSGPLALMERSGIFRSTIASMAWLSRSSGGAGAWASRSRMGPRIRSRTMIMCSKFSAIDQHSGDGLKRHCASDRPAVTASTRPRVWLKYWRAWSRSVDSRVVILLSFADTTREFAEIDWRREIFYEGMIGYHKLHGLDS